MRWWRRRLALIYRPSLTRRRRRMAQHRQKQTEAAQRRAEQCVGLRDAFPDFAHYEAWVRTDIASDLSDIEETVDIPEVTTALILDMEALVISQAPTEIHQVPDEKLEFARAETEATSIIT